MIKINSVVMLHLKAVDVTCQETKSNTKPKCSLYRPLSADVYSGGLKLSATIVAEEFFNAFRMLHALVHLLLLETCTFT